MHSNQASALRFALDSRPRGLKIGDRVCYADKTFSVLAIQQWAFNKGGYAVGLVWSGTCSNCGGVWYQLTETRVTHLNEECPKCDLVGIRTPTIDGQVAQNLLNRGPVPAPVKPPAPPIERYGAVERLLIELIKEYPEGVGERMFIAHCAETLPKPDAGKRDQRVFITKRALQSLAQRKNSPIRRDENGLIFAA